MSDAFFKAIADANRRKILALLKKEGVMTAGKIAEHFEISKPALSEHLKILRNADLICSIKKKQFIHYSLNTTILEDVLGWFKEITARSEEKTK
ncbi:MAG: autorepressor SdpR family transcription factor [Candidatus Cloacimonetes bacterium]|jgi:DNA-binding transcriptional ArsR family regulator|nr:autorepressor SdpR family transcription factor [Candidatus Cloacimonadota bacterium]MCB5286516.1 autorepressor SdpR family transcription factor [Candidatus Cloacimonadota bacterium]MCK9185140.1 autorepressor SdpR family transcription factor [Candidatus Cloacimonadota bacterium]MCK9584277.1 autorepressor SdpR family transcription factor [Candidatus Cloacimonadota bacterium]MDY0228838.1 autorepressor SdpR family transcription factor [Candidatus Cloacimonadaceae bacterium]